MPGPRGRAPTSSAMSASWKALRGSSVPNMPASSGKAQSSISIMTPCNAFCALSSGDLQHLQDHRLVGAEHLAGGDAEQQAVADLAGGAGHGDSNGGFHGFDGLLAMGPGERCCRPVGEAFARMAERRQTLRGAACERRRDVSQAAPAVSNRSYVLYKTRLAVAA